MLTMKMSLRSLFLTLLSLLFLNNSCLALNFVYIEEDSSILLRIVDIFYSLLIVSWFVFAVCLLLFLILKLIGKINKSEDFISKINMHFGKIIYLVLCINVCLFLFNFISFIMVVVPSSIFRLCIAIIGILILLMFLCFSVRYRINNNNKLAFIFILIDAFIIEVLLFAFFAVF